MNRPQHVLVVDDDEELRALVSRSLRNEGFRVTCAEDGTELRARLSDRAIDIIVLDLMLPGKDGLTLCRELRNDRVATPIIMLTAKGSDIDRILGLELGADDYMAKPFNSRELSARIRAVLRRSADTALGTPTMKARYFAFNGWMLDARRRELRTPDGVVMPLSSGEYDLIHVLLQKPNTILSRDQLLELTSGRSGGALDRSIDMHVSRLRRKLGDDPREPAVIRTVRSGGYLFAADVNAS